MDNTAKEYAAALVLLGNESGETNAFADALGVIHAQFQKYPSYIDMLACPAISKTERTHAIREVFEGIVPDAVLLFTQVLCQNGHIRLFPACYQAYMDTYRAMQKIAIAHIVSAIPLTIADKRQLKDILQNKTGYTIETNYTVDPSLLGGVIVEINGTVINGSLKQRLQQLKEVIAP